MRRGLGLLFATAILAALAYVSRFWVFSWWGREGLFGVERLSSGGDLWRSWMADAGLGPYDVMLWAVACFVLLSAAQRLWSRIFRD